MKKDSKPLQGGLRWVSWELKDCEDEIVKETFAWHLTYFELEKNDFELKEFQ